MIDGLTPYSFVQVHNPCGGHLTVYLTRVGDSIVRGHRWSATYRKWIPVAEPFHRHDVTAVLPASALTFQQQTTIPRKD